jgi:hypothetical protein
LMLVAIKRLSLPAALAGASVIGRPALASC